MSGLHHLTLPGAMLERGFWLYVWRVTAPSSEMLYVGRTGDNSSPHATAPYTRMGQHLGKIPNQSALRNHLKNRGIEAEACSSFDLVAHGPLYPEVVKDVDCRDTLMARHKPMRDQVGAMEKLLCDGLKAAGYDVLNTVNCRWKLDETGAQKWFAAKEAFREVFPALG
ncbi:hypothetical protein K3553_11835 [Leisingera aquaemixtae]|uniref:hypothetical protein n=1 Tax=Leisingera aquaemixtae TaxID=1396826 RepID=UPI0021A5B22A|nr:hypothetical protein [Leisingera aquaemixtae]UWQ23669.1 hypothetical protein K3553_11835 [Leisingera aquaemixtae]